MSVSSVPTRIPSLCLDTNGVPKRRCQLVLAAASGVILGLSMPSPNWWPLAWIGLVPLFIAIRDAGPGRAALLGLLTGIVYCGIFARWLLIFGGLPWAAVITYQALAFCLFAAMYARLARLRSSWLFLVLVPSAWVAVQFVKTLGTYACAWGSLAHTQANVLPVIQIASITGPWGIDFLICLVSFAISAAIANYSSARSALIVAASLTLAALAFGTLSLAANAPTKDGHLVAVLQGNLTNDQRTIPNLLEHSFKTYEAMSEEAARHRPAIILWPETSMPTGISSPGPADEISKLARRLDTWVLMGGYDWSTDPSLAGYYNTLFAFDRHGKMAGRYHKVQLVPYGEFVPLREQMPFLKRYGVRVDDVLPADSHMLLDTPIGKIGTSICFESTFPQIARVETRDGAEVLVVVSNDAWFKRSGAIYQHYIAARLRAVENRRFVIRAANTGISAVIDPYGRVRRQLGLEQKGMILDKVVPSRKLTLYTRLGDWLAYLCVALTAVCLCISPRKPGNRPTAKRKR